MDKTTPFQNIPLSVLKLKTVKVRTGLSGSSIYRKMDEDDFPKQIRLGKRSVGWLEHEIDEWIKKQVNVSRQYEGVANY